MTPILRHGSRGVVAAILSVALALSLAVWPADAFEDVDAEQQFIDLINADRRGAGLRELTPAADVRNVAMAWSRQMASERRMYHNPSYYEQFCCWLRAAENVGWTTVSDMGNPAVVSAAVERLHQAFMDSPGHRANIMQARHDHIGLAIEMRADSCPDGVGIRDCMWVTENFREWDGTQPAGGLANPYAGNRGSAGDDVAPVPVSDKVRRGGFDGNTETVERLGRHADSAIQVSRARFRDGRATHAVISRDDRFPDALAGAPLTADGPMLFTSTGGINRAVRDELRRVLPKGATVYLLGGEVALSKDVERIVSDLGLKPRRLAGETRVDTALAVASEVRRLYGDSKTVAVARASGAASDPDGPTGWVDSVTGGAWAARGGTPVIITPTDDLPASVRRWLAADAPRTTVVFGGPVALSDAVVSRLPNGVRIWGEDRADTAAAVSRRLWGVTPSSNNRKFVVVDGWARDGWRHGLAAAGLAADAGAPMLLANSQSSRQPAGTGDMVGACNTPSVDVLLVGGLDDTLAARLEAFDGRTC